MNIANQKHQRLTFVDSPYKMSFLTYKDKIEDGDVVILFLGHNYMLPLKVKKGETHQTRYGALRHDDVIGKSYGSQIECTKGYIYVLHVTPELWTQNLPHRTQIIYSTDISLITFNLDLKPGSIVIESGTGSGSLSHAIIRTIAPTGHLHTFDFHEVRVQKAQEEFIEHGVDHLVTIKHADACKDGFGLEDTADAVFLDLPCPWEALPHAKRAMKKQGGRICSFSPCIEQVQRACDKMTELGFKDIQTEECLLRTFDLKTSNIPYPDLGEEINQTFQKVIASNEKDKKEGETEEKSSEDTEDTEQGMDIDEEKESTPKSKDNKKQNDKNGKEKNLLKTCAPIRQIPGHTGFLTFATLYPTM